MNRTVSSQNIDISQRHLMNKIEIYLERQGRDLSLAKGYCKGLTILWLFVALQEDPVYEINFINWLKQISSWNEQDDIDTTFEKLFSHIEWLQRQFSLLTRSHDLFDALKLFEEENLKSLSPLQLEYDLGFLFRKDELKAIFKQVIKEKKGIFLGSHNHGVGLINKGDYYRFYDSNNRFGVIALDGLDEVLDQILEAFILENDRQKIEAEKKNLVYVPLKFYVLDRAGAQKANYRDTKQLIIELVKKRLESQLESGLYAVGWEKTSALTMADTGSKEVILKLTKSTKAIPNTDEDSIKQIQNAITAHITSEMDSYEHLAEFQHALLPLTLHVNQDQVQLRKALSTIFPDSSILHEAVLQNKVLIVSDILHNHYVEIDTKNKMGQSALDLAKTLGNQEIIKLLEMEEIRKAIIDNNLDFIEKNYKEEIVSFLQGNDPNFFHPLFMAIELKKNEAIQFFLAHPPTEDVMCGGKNALHFAIISNDRKTASILINKFNYNPKKMDGSKTSPLELAIIKGDREMINLLLPYFENESLYPYISGAITVISPEIIKYLLSFERQPVLDINEVNIVGNTLLHQAAYRDDPNFFAFLISCGANPRIANHQGNTPLHLVVEQGKPALITLLLSHKVDRNAQNKEGNTAIHLAVKSGKPALVKLLMDKGVDLHLKNAKGETPLDILHNAIKTFENSPQFKGNLALEAPHLDDILKLFKNKLSQNFFQHIAKNDYVLARLLFRNWGFYININWRDQENRTALHQACFNGNLQLVDFLLKNDANIHAKSDYQYQPLHYAILSENEDICFQLIEKGVDINAKTTKGLTPLHLAAQKNNLALVKLLIKEGANPNHRMEKGLLPFEMAHDERIREYLFSVCTDKLVQENQDLLNKVLTCFKELSCYYKIDPNFTEELMKLSINVPSDDFCAKLIEKLSQFNPENAEQIPYSRLSFWNRIGTAPNIDKEINNMTSTLHQKQVQFLDKKFR